MSRVVQLSEAASIAIHSMVLIAKSREQLNASKIADLTGVSRNHLAKVMQRLVKDSLVKSTRGPLGGFVLAKKPESITLLDVYQSIEGPVLDGECPNKEFCPFEECAMGGIVVELSAKFKDYMLNRKLSDYIKNKRSK
jgi:Rrf2 family transcriptional regulator, nitric oxide-sensitive transcriptional repressor